MKSITLMGMSGVGKTTLSDKLPKNKWFHYSADYRIASHYLNDPINDMLISEAMKSPVIANLLKSDSIYIGSNLSTNNLAPSSAYISKLGDIELGGLDFEIFINRQELHYSAEISATYDIGYFKKRAKTLYNYEYFLHDAGGSVCEIDDEKVIDYMAKETKLIYIHANDNLIQTITQRALDYPKPLYFNKAFLLKNIEIYKEQTGLEINKFNPNNFIRFIVPKLIKHREERYLQIADKYGITIDADTAFKVRDEKDFLDMIKQ